MEDFYDAHYPPIGAEVTTLEQKVIKVTPEAYEQFLRRLDRTPMPNARLIKTMQTKAPWDKNDS